MVTPIKISSPAGTDIGVEYATVNAFSKDNRWLLLTQSGGWFRLHDGDGKYIRTLPSDVNTSSRPRWSRFNPDSLTYLAGNSIHAFDVSGTISLVSTFSEYASIQDGGEADLSIDGKHRVLAGTKPNGTVEVFVFDMTARQKGTTWKYGAFDGLKISSDNRIIISQPLGIFVGGDKPWRSIAPHNAHACPAQYKGRPVLLWENGAQHLVIIDLETGQQTIVPFVLDYAYVTHVSACDKPFCIVSTSAPKNDKPSQIVRISLEDLSSEVLCETGTVYRGYESQPKASLSRDGSRVVYSVDDGKQVSAWMLKLSAEEKPALVNPNLPLRYTWDKHRVTIDRDGITIVAA